MQVWKRCLLAQISANFSSKTNPLGTNQDKFQLGVRVVYSINICNDEFLKNVVTSKIASDLFCFIMICEAMVTQSLLISSVKNVYKIIKKNINWLL